MVRSMQHIAMIPLVGDIGFARAMYFVSRDDMTAMVTADSEIIPSTHEMIGGTFMMADEMIGMTDEITIGTIAMNTGKIGQIKFRIALNGIAIEIGRVQLER